MHDRTDEIRWRVAHGDLMQSSLSRVIEAIQVHAEEIPALGYEANMALHEGGSAIAQWTEARKTNWPNVIRNQMDSETGS